MYRHDFDDIIFGSNFSRRGSLTQYMLIQPEYVGIREVGKGILEKEVFEMNNNQRSSQAPRTKKSYRRSGHNTRPYLNQAEIKGLFGPFGAGGNAAGGAGGTAGGGELLGQFGGIDGIMSTMGKVQKIFALFQQLSPMFKQFGGLGGLGGLGGAAGVRAKTSCLPIKSRSHRGKQVVDKRKHR